MYRVGDLAIHFKGPSIYELLPTHHWESRTTLATRPLDGPNGHRTLRAYTRAREVFVCIAP